MWPGWSRGGPVARLQEDAAYPDNVNKIS